MKPTLLRILKNGLVTAAVLAGMGFVAAELGGMYLASQTSTNRQDDELNSQAVTALRYQLPLGMAAWGFGLVALFEILLWLVRGNPAPPPTKRATDTPEKLFDDLLKRAEAQNVSTTGHAPPPTENTPGSAHPAAPDNPLS
jgi:hypothetical protein